MSKRKRWEDIRPLTQKELEAWAALPLGESGDEHEEQSSDSEDEDNLENDFSPSGSEYEPAGSDEDSSNSERSYRQLRKSYKKTVPLETEQLQLLENEQNEAEAPTETEHLEVLENEQSEVEPPMETEHLEGFENEQNDYQQIQNNLENEQTDANGSMTEKKNNRVSKVRTGTAGVLLLPPRTQGFPNEMFCI